MASVENGAEVIIPAPYWVSYPDMVIANDGKPIIVECPQEKGFKLTPEALEAAITRKTLWLILNTPQTRRARPTPGPNSRHWATFCSRHPHVFVLSDDIYEQIWFDDEPITTLAAAVPALKEPHPARERRVEILRHDGVADRLCCRT